jgi:hypothetical protein
MESKEKQKGELEELRIELSQQEMEESARKRDEVFTVSIKIDSIFCNRESERDSSFWMHIKNKLKISTYCWLKPRKKKKSSVKR